MSECWASIGGEDREVMEEEVVEDLRIDLAAEEAKAEVVVAEVEIIQGHQAKEDSIEVQVEVQEAKEDMIGNQLGTRTGDSLDRRESREPHFECNLEVEDESVLMMRGKQRNDEDVHNIIILRRLLPFDFVCIL